MCVLLKAFLFTNCLIEILLSLAAIGDYIRDRKRREVDETSAEKSWSFPPVFDTAQDSCTAGHVLLTQPHRKRGVLFFVLLVLCLKCDDRSFLMPCMVLFISNDFDNIFRAANTLL